MGHGDVPSGKLLAISEYGYIYIYIVYHNYTIYVVYPLVNSQFANLKMAIEIVDLPIKNGDVPSFVGLPEGMGMEQ